MGSRLFSRAVIAIIFSLQLTSAQNIAQCPTVASSYTGAGGVKYAICPSSDFQGRSDQILNNIASVSACAQTCDKIPTCQKAVYDTTGKKCHIKNNGANALTWVENGGQLTTIYLNNTLPERTNIAQCPYTETSAVYGGKTYKICPSTDIRGASTQMVRNIASTAACAQLCSTAGNGCVRAVYDKAGSVCHLKADATTNTLLWSTNKQFDVIRQDIVVSPATKGSWSDLIRLPVVPVAAYIVPAYPEPSRMLLWSSWGVDAFGGEGGRTQFADYNFQTGAVSQRTIANTQHDMFCPGISSLEDGRIIISGGSDADDTTFFEPATNKFVKGPALKTARGYQTSTTLSDGRVFTIGGAFAGGIKSKDGEVFDPSTNAWTSLPGAKVAPMLTVDAEGIWRTDNHGWLLGWKNGSVFQAGPSKAQNWYVTAGNGSVGPAGVRDTQDSMCGVYVMYEPGKILSAGGSQDYTNSDATNKAHITTITEPNEPSTVEQVPSMVYARGFANAVVLPDGQVLVTGGQKRSLVFTDTDGALFPEMFNPATKNWTTLAQEAVPRNYHAASLLLPDATVWSGGGGLCYVPQVGASSANCDKSVDHMDGQIFSPPYLFNEDGSAAKRPVLSTPPPSVKVGGKLTVNVDVSDATLVLIRIGTVTHSVNSDQRRIPLTNVVAGGTSYNATLPADSGILIPGYYYLFALSSGGVPSVAKTIQITL
ncbi:hypothetical protein N0V93_008675 [Gnomoniopsis smithogilvyi]|uniref:Apple domain-containing protein n=1 Tax=Gnomoniopsis smithogilvyi TaxID=1191159 RepID=A0A9W8YM54_9PEZI|nr:hypothetical protein N0V93_008675 [Gnomoniopsis smithogilvyi]